MGKFTEELNKKILQKEIEEKSPRTKRDQYNTFMNTFEWYNVEMAGFIRDHLKEKKSLFVFPYFSHLYELMRVTYRSIQAASAHDPLSKVIFSEYGAMAAFINIFTAMEYIPKGIFSWGLRPFLQKQNDTELQHHFAKYYESYAGNLETIAFYNHDYKGMRETLQNGYRQCAKVSWADYFSYQYMVGESYLRGFLSVPLQKIYNDPNNLVPPTTDILVKFRSSFKDEVDAKKDFMNALTDAKVSVVKDHVYVKENKNKNYTSVYGLLASSRYRAFTATLRELSKQKIAIKKMAGNDFVQIKCFIDAKDEKALMEKQNALHEMKSVQPLFDYKDYVHAAQRMCLLKVPVTKLQETVANIDHQDEMKLDFIHNF